MLIKSHEQLNQTVCETFFPRNCQRWDYIILFSAKKQGIYCFTYML